MLTDPTRILPGPLHRSHHPGACTVTTFETMTDAELDRLLFDDQHNRAAVIELDARDFARNYKPDHGDGIDLVALLREIAEHGATIITSDFAQRRLLGAYVVERVGNPRSRHGWYHITPTGRRALAIIDADNLPAVTP